MGRKAYTPEQKQIAQIEKNTWRRALYNINRIIKAGASYRIDEFKGLKELKKSYKEFQTRTNLANTGNLEEDIKTFIHENINIRTPKQAEKASDNLLKNLKKAVEEINDVGDPKKASEKAQRYYNVMLQSGAISKKSEKRGGPKKWTLDEDKVPKGQDFANVSDKYLKWKRWIQRFFPGKEYAEAYGSEPRDEG